MRKTKAKTKAKPKVARPPNKLFPGLPRYTGPQRGYFGFVHHAKLFEPTCDDISVRIQYIKDHKPRSEVRTRLRHVIYLGRALTKRIKQSNMHSANGAIYHEPVREAVVKYAKRHIKPLRWNGRSLCHATGAPFQGY